MASDHDESITDEELAERREPRVQTDAVLRDGKPAKVQRLRQSPDDTCRLLWRDGESFQAALDRGECPVHGDDTLRGWRDRVADGDMDVRIVIEADPA